MSNISNIMETPLPTTEEEEPIVPLTPKETIKLRRRTKRLHRTKLVIIYHILNHIEKNRIENEERGTVNWLTGHRRMGITRLMYGLQTSNTQFKDFLRFLVETKLVVRQEYTRK